MIVKIQQHPTTSNNQITTASPNEMNEKEKPKKHQKYNKNKLKNRIKQNCVLLL